MATDYVRNRYRSKIRQEYIRRMSKLKKQIQENNKIAELPLPDEVFEDDIENMRGVYEAWEQGLEKIQIELEKKYHILEIEHEGDAIRIIL